MAVGDNFSVMRPSKNKTKYRFQLSTERWLPSIVLLRMIKIKRM
jgi:hypothetical protein